jgi:hypothetical protein
MRSIVSKSLTALVAIGTTGFLTFGFALPRAQAKIVGFSNEAKCKNAQAKREKAGYIIQQGCYYAGAKFFGWNIDKGPWRFQFKDK